MGRAIFLVLTALLCWAHSTPLQQPLVERSSRRPPPQQRHQYQSQGNAEGESQEYYNRGGSAEGTGGREGARRRRLTSATATKLAANQHQFAQEPQSQQQQEATGEESTTTTTATTATTGAGAAESRPAAAAAGRSDTGVQGSETALEGAVVPEARVQEVQMDIIEGEGQGAGSDGTVEAMEGGGAEEDKGIEEGEAGGFVVVAQDGKPEEGENGDSPDNDNSSTNGISNNIMVIVFCALAFVANGGFLVYVFWVM